jgi:Tfp pilus assembly major pilin PilA
MAKSVSKRQPPKAVPVVGVALATAAARSAAGKAVQKLVAKHGAKIVERALKAANTPAKGKTAGAARASGKQYQSGVNREVKWRQDMTKSSWREGGPTLRQSNPSAAAKSDKEFAAMKTRTKINKARNK